MAVFEVPDADAFARDVLGADEPTVVAFWAEWCPHCRRFRPHFEKAADARRGRFAIARIDEYTNPLWERYAIDVVPTVAYFRGGDLAARRDGKLGRGVTEAELIAFLDEVLPTPTPG
jgi:thioredoxin 1